MGFGDVLKTMREKAGLSQSQLAERAGIPVQSIQNWEQGHRVPRSAVLLTLARAVGVPVEKLLSEIGDQAEAEPPAAAAEQPPPGAPKKGRKKGK
jgi:transcriptional regulator with XRE-family HTH domain